MNHLEAHLYAAWLEEPELAPPLAVLIASGGHTLLVIVEDHGRYHVVGQTVDDAAGEAFDKVARFLGLGYPGGPAIDRLAPEGAPDAIPFPRAMPGEANFSFSGLKTAVVQHVRRASRRGRSPTSPRPSRRRSSTSSSTKLMRRRRRGRRADARRSAAGSPRTPRSGPGSTRPRPVRPPGVPARPRLCTDNAAMIAATAWWRLAADGPTPLDAGVDPGLRLPSTA